MTTIRVTQTKLARGPWGRIPSLLLTLTAAFLVSGCGDLFSVDNPTNILDKDLNDPQLLNALGNTPEGAVSAPPPSQGNGTGDGYAGAIAYAEMVGDAAFHASTRTSRLELAEGFMDGWNETYEAVYNDLASARWIADDATARMEELLGSDASHDKRIANGYFWSGIARLTMGDLFAEVTFDGNPPVTPAEAIQSGIDKMQQAASVAAAGGEVSLEAAAYGQIARGYRALYFESKYTNGSADISVFEQAEFFAQQALDTKADYWTDVHYATPGSSNAVYSRYSTGNIYDNMDPRYANQVDPVSGQRDPRIKHGSLLTVAANGKEVYEQSKYSNRSADIPVSRWQEAELIIAESRLMHGDLQGAVDRINQVRAAVPLPPFASTDHDAIFQQLLYERKTEFWLELRRWQDMRYYEIMPSDWAPINKQAGVHRRWPVSILERQSNPYYQGG